MENVWENVILRKCRWCYARVFPYSDTGDISDFQAINVNAKVLSIGNQSTLKVRGKILQKVDAIIADQTATVVLSLFYGRIILH